MPLPEPPGTNLFLYAILPIRRDFSDRSIWRGCPWILSPSHISKGLTDMRSFVSGVRKQAAVDEIDTCSHIFWIPLCPPVVGPLARPDITVMCPYLFQKSLYFFGVIECYYDRVIKNGQDEECSDKNGPGDKV